MCYIYVAWPFCFDFESIESHRISSTRKTSPEDGIGLSESYRYVSRYQSLE